MSPTDKGNKVYFKLTDRLWCGVSNLNDETALMVGPKPLLTEFGIDNCYLPAGFEINPAMLCAF